MEVAVLLLAFSHRSELQKVGSWVSFGLYFNQVSPAQQEEGPECEGCKERLIVTVELVGLREDEPSGARPQWRQRGELKQGGGGLMM